MVKPSINPEGGKKEAMKEAKGKEAFLPAFAVIPLGSDLPPQMDDSAVEVVAVVNRPRKLGVCLCLAMTLTVLLIMGLATAMFLGHASGKYMFRCGVGYEDDYEDYYRDGEYEAMEGKPAGTLDEDVEVRPFEGYERMEIPAQGYCERLTIIHDFTMNLTAYKLYSSAVCYIGKLDEETVMAPSEFIKNAEENPAFLTQHYETVYETYRAILPEISLEYTLEYGFFIPMLCSDVPSYLIEKIPAEELGEWEDYWEDEEEGEGSMDGLELAGRPKPLHRRRRDTDKKSAVDKLVEFTGKFITKFKILKPEVVQAKENLKAKIF